MAKTTQEKAKEAKKMMQNSFKRWQEPLGVYFAFEYLFNKPKTTHRIDAALTCCKIAFEMEGGAFAGMGHRNVGAFLHDMQKYNLLTLRGWHLFRFTTTDIKNGEHINWLTDYLAIYPCPHMIQQPPVIMSGKLF